MATIRSSAPIIAAVLLLLPVLYVGSYLTLVVPGGNPPRVPLINEHYPPEASVESQSAAR